jgi:anti-sigma factor RsiW
VKPRHSHRQDDLRNERHLTAEPPAVLMRHLDGEGRPAERARIEAHLARCRPCADEVRAFRALFAAVAALPPSPAPPPPFLAARILAAVAADRAARRRPRWLEVLGTSYAGSAVGLLLVLGLSPWRADLLEGLRGVFSMLFSGSVSAFVGAFDRVVSLLTAVVRLREAAAEALLPLAPLGRSLEVLAAQPELRVGLAVALVLTTALWWILNHHRPAGGRGRMNDVPAFF